MGLLRKSSLLGRMISTLIAPVKCSVCSFDLWFHEYGDEMLEYCM